MSAQISILVGPARSGKTTRLIADYRAALSAGGPGCALWLGPNRHAITALREQLLDDGMTHCANPQCMTFGQFTQSVLDASGGSLRPLSEIMKQQLLKELIQRGVKEDIFQHFKPIADTPGLLQLFASTIREWKRLEIWPNELFEACERVGLTQKDRELLWLYDEYQQVLNSHHLYDAEGRAWTARERLREGQQKPFEHVRHVFVDGFTDFTRTEREILDVLTTRVVTLTISLPLDTRVKAMGLKFSKQGVFRNDLFARPQETQRKFQTRRSPARMELMARRTTGWAAMDHLEANLFQTPSEIQPVEDSAGIEIVAAAGQLNEIEGIARRIKRLLAGSGSETSANEILVVFRSLNEVGPLVREVFDRYGIPHFIQASDTLGQAASIGSLVAWLRLAADDWEFRPLLAMLSHNSFRPEWKEWQRGKASVAAEHLVRQLQLPSGKAELIRRVSRLLAPPDSEPAVVESEWRIRRRAQAALAHPLLQKLAKTFDGLPKRDSPTNWARALTEFANQVGLSKIIVGSPRESAAWDRLMTSLRSLDRLARWTNNKAKTFSLQDVLEFVTEIASNETLPAANDDVGRVRIVNAATARSLSAPYVFVAGLTEKAFPATEREDKLYSDSETARLINVGLPFRTRVDHSQAEMLLFYEVVTRATRKLILSYPGLDAKAQPLTPSPYLTELERAFGDGKLSRHIDQELSPVPRVGDVLSERDLRLRSVYDALHGEKNWLVGMVKRSRGSDASSIQRHAIGNLLKALQTNHARSCGPGFGTFEGIFESDSVVAALAARFGPTRCWSPSQLEAYAYCPFRYFAERVMKLEPLGDLALEVDHALRGQLLHGALTSYHRNLNEARGNPTSPSVESAEEFEKAAADVLAMLLETLATDEPVQQALREVDRRLLSQWLTNYYGQHKKYDELWSETDEPLRPAHFEVSFGPASDFIEDSDDLPVAGDSLTTSLPLELQQSGESLFFRGRVDRVDLGRIAGQEVFNVVDYKSGSKYRFSVDSISSGETIQLPLYALAIEQLLLADRGALAWQASYWQIKEKGFNHRSALQFRQCIDGVIEPVESWLELRDRLMDRIFALVRGIRQGQFPMHCADEHCTGRCDFRTVCRVAQVRSLEKTWQPPEEADK